jgi:hypothetical protein
MLFKKNPKVTSIDKVQLSNDEIQGLFVLLFPWSEKAQEYKAILHKANTSTELNSHLYHDNAKKIRRTHQPDLGKEQLFLFLTKHNEAQLVKDAFKFSAQTSTAEYLFCCLAILEIQNRMTTNSGYNFWDILPMLTFVGRTFFNKASHYDLNLSGDDFKVTQPWVQASSDGYARINLTELVKNTATVLSQQFNSYFPKNINEKAMSTETAKVELRPKVMEGYNNLLELFTTEKFTFPADYTLNGAEIFSGAEQLSSPRIH